MMKASAVATSVVSLMSRVLGVRFVERPGELGPCPPHQPEDDDSPKHSETVEIVRQHRRDLGHCENEDQIEEQLHEGGALFRSATK